MKNSFEYILEMVWLLTSILCLAAGVGKMIRFGFDDSYLFFIFAALSFVIYLTRRHRRRTMKEYTRKKNDE